MTFGDLKGIVLRKAVIGDLDSIKRLVDRHKHELGFIVRQALERSIYLSEIIVAVNSSEEIIGLIHYHHRKDAQTTLYNIVVDKESQRQGIGRNLIDRLAIEARDHHQHFILLKCPQQLPANNFYQDYGFTLSTIDKGKKKPLSIWRIEIPIS